MQGRIEFYFDFSSPYGYLTSELIDDFAARHGRKVEWKPFLLGVLFRTTGQRPLLSIPLKGDYARHDLARSARAMAVPFVVPDSFPFMSQAACRAFYWLHDQDRDLARKLAKTAYRAAFGEGRDISKPEMVVDIAAGLGISREDLSAALNDPKVKDRLRQEVDQAVAKGVFGSPFLIVDGEPFWGHDRLSDVERWLESGGW